MHAYYYYFIYGIAYIIILYSIHYSNTHYIYIILYSFRWRIRWRRVHDRWRCVYIRALCHKYYYKIIYYIVICFSNQPLWTQAGFANFRSGVCRERPSPIPRLPCDPLPTTKISGRKKIPLPSLPPHSYSPPFFCDGLLRYYTDGSAAI